MDENMGTVLLKSVVDKTEKGESKQLGCYDEVEENVEEG
jgi:hypothetical protein